MIVGFIIFQNAKLRLLELYYNFLKILFAINNFEELEMDTDSLNLAFAEKELENSMRTEMKAEGELVQSIDCTDSFFAVAD